MTMKSKKMKALPHNTITESSAAVKGLPPKLASYYNGCNNIRICAQNKYMLVSDGKTRSSKNIVRSVSTTVQLLAFWRYSCGANMGLNERLRSVILKENIEHNRENLKASEWTHRDSKFRKQSKASVGKRQWHFMSHEYYSCGFKMWPCLCICVNICSLLSM